jgi:hypothetical protein
MNKLAEMRNREEVVDCLKSIESGFSSIVRFEMEELESRIYSEIIFDNNYRVQLVWEDGKYFIQIVKLDGDGKAGKYRKIYDETEYTVKQISSMDELLNELKEISEYDKKNNVFDFNDYLNERKGSTFRLKILKKYMIKINNL